MKRPLRVAYFAPHIQQNGVFRWIWDLANAADPARLEWVGGCVRGVRDLDVDCVTELARVMPVHCGDPLAWHYTETVPVQFHNTTEAAIRAAAERADVILAWECSEWLSLFDTLPAQVILVSHSTWWRPENPPSPYKYAAVSERAAGPFRYDGHETEVVLTGISLDRVAPRRGRLAQRKAWRLGPGHAVIGAIGRNDPAKHYSLVEDALAQLPARFKGVFYGPERNTQQIQSHPFTKNIGDVYAGLDLLVVASQFESFGQVMVEAWAAGCPTLVRENLGCVNELERMVGKPLCYKFQGDDPADLAFAIEHVTTLGRDTDITREAQRLATTHLSAPAMAERWADYLERTVTPHVTVAAPKLTVTPRWHTPERAIRVLLHCNDPELLTATRALGHAVSALAPATLPKTAPLCPVITDHSGPPWAVHYARLADGLRVYAGTADVYAAIGVEPVPNLPIPCVRRLQDIPGAVAVASGDCLEVRAVVLCSHIGYGGIERWLAGICEYATSVHVVTIIEMGELPQNPLMVELLTDLGAEVVTAVNPQHAASLLHTAGADLVIVCGIQYLGWHLPPDFTAPTLLVSHGPPQDYWTQQWLWTSSGITTHALAVSQIAACSFPLQWRDKTTVLYPGVEIPAPRDLGEKIRAQMQLQPDDFLVVYSGRVDDFKQPQLLVKALALLPENVKFLHVGYIEPGSDYPALVRRLLPRRHLMTGYVDEDIEHLAAADLVVMPSKAESFGLVLVKALGIGRQVLAPAVSIVSELRLEPGWEWLPEPLPEDCTVEVLAERVRALVGTPRQIYTYNEPHAQQIRSRFNPAQAGQHFSDYAAQVVMEPHIRRGGWHQISAPRPELAPRLPGPQVPPGAADAIVPLGDDIERSAAEISRLLTQNDCWVTVHIGGTRAQLTACRAQLSSDLYRGRIVTYVTEADPTLNEMVLLSHAHWRADAVLLNTPQTVSIPTRAAKTVSLLRNSDTEVVLFGQSRGNCLTVRSSALIDLMAFGGLPEDEAGWLAQPPWRITRHVPGPQQLSEDYGDSTLMHMPEVTVDVVLPFRGQLDYLHQTLRGLWEQDGVALMTIHLIDDCSPDREAVQQLIGEWQARIPPDGRIQLRTYRTSTNIGQFAAVNAAAHYCKSEFIMIQDGDDISRPHRAWLSANALRASGAGIFAAAARGFGGWVGVVASRYPSNNPDIWREYDIVNPTVMIRRSEFMRLGGYADFGSASHNKTSLDTEFALRAAQQGVRFHISAEVLTSYRQHEESCSAAAGLKIGGAIRREVNTDIARQTLTKALPYLRGSVSTRSARDIIPDL